jgi:hypothetical protein
MEETYGTTGATRKPYGRKNADTDMLIEQATTFHIPPT